MRPVVVRKEGRRGRQLLLLTGFLILGMLGLGTASAHAATRSSLAGETLTGPRPPSELTGTCNSESEGHINFSVTGTATGPFPGTFTESGSFTTASGGSLTAFSSTFTITGTAGTVTGSKSLSGDTGKATCRFQEPNGPIFVSAFNLTTTYTATINGALRSAGTATVSIEGFLGEDFSFNENFASAGVVQLTSKQQCMDGGWQSFGFKNRGDCVSFVATGGKNPPSGS